MLVTVATADFGRFSLCVCVKFITFTNSKTKHTGKMPFSANLEHNI